MMTETQKRVARAMSMLDSGMEAREVARECGYKNVNGMMGAIALHGRRNTEEQKQEAEQPAASAYETPVPKENNWENKGGYKKPWENKSSDTEREDAAPVGMRTKANACIVVEVGGVRLQYNAETDSVMMTISGNPRYFWISKRDKTASQLMRSLRDAAGAMTILLGEKNDV